MSLSKLEDHREHMGRAISVSELSHSIETRLQNGDNKAVFYNERMLGNQELMVDVKAIKALLRAQGVQLGDKILLAKENSYVFVAIYLALIQYGATVVPINPAMPEPELLKVGTRAEARGAFVGDGILARIDLTQLPSLQFMVSIAATFQPGDAMKVERIAKLNGPPGKWQAPDEQTNAILLFTSGTTGQPKGVALTHAQVFATVTQVIATHELTATDITYCFLPLFHINAQVVALLSTIVSGGSLIIEERFSASRFWSTVERHQVTWISAVPTVIGILLKTAELRVAETHPVPASLRFVRSASAPLPMLYAKRFESRFGVPIIESYGITEAASQVCVNPLPPGKRKLGSVGLPAGVELQIVGDDGRVVAAHERGEIAIRGRSVIRHYAYGDEGKDSFRNGWFYTGDLGHVDEDGYVYITGRKKEMINRAGQKISPREVEDVISQHDGIRSVAVIGLPDELHGERVAAFLVVEPWHLDESGLVEAVNALCRRSLSAYKCPEEYHVVEAIPAGPTGKVQRHRLKEAVLACGAR